MDVLVREKKIEQWVKKPRSQLLLILHRGLWAPHCEKEPYGTFSAYLELRVICLHCEPVCLKLKEMDDYKYWTPRSVEKYLMISRRRQKRDFWRIGANKVIFFTKTKQYLFIQIDIVHHITYKHHWKRKG